MIWAAFVIQIDYRARPEVDRQRVTVGDLLKDDCFAIQYRALFTVHEDFVSWIVVVSPVPLKRGAVPLKLAVPAQVPKRARFRRPVLPVPLEPHMCGKGEEHIAQ